MKRIFLVLALLGAVSVQGFGAITVATNLMGDAIATNDFLQKVLYFADSIKTQVENAVNTYNQMQLMVSQVEMATKNLSGLKDVTDWESGMEWYNRQLEAERAAAEAIDRITLKVGPGQTPVKLADIDAMLDGTYFEKINDAFMQEIDDMTVVLEDGVSEGDKMKYNALIRLGVTPANYNWLHATAEKEKETARLMSTGGERVNDDNMAAAERAKALSEQVASEDAGEKAIGMATIETLQDLNLAVRQGNYDEAKFREWQLWTWRQTHQPDAGVFLRSPPGKSLTFGEVSEYTVEAVE